MGNVTWVSLASPRTIAPIPSGIPGALELIDLVRMRQESTTAQGRRSPAVRVEQTTFTLRREKAWET